MTPLYTQQEFDSAKSKDLLPLQCELCLKSFSKSKNYIHSHILNPHANATGNHCSIQCSNSSKKKYQSVSCLNCNLSFKKKEKEILKSPNHFCGSSCAASYNNRNKTHGYRRSKLEIWLEEQLTALYPDLQIDYNKKNTIGSELDIYISSLNLAIELNGIFHYEPIYGIKKLDQIQNNDISKSKACHDAKIDLCIIDTSSQSYVKPKTSQKYLNIVKNIIDRRIEAI